MHEGNQELGRARVLKNPWFHGVYSLEPGVCLVSYRSISRHLKPSTLDEQQLGGLQGFGVFGCDVLRYLLQDSSTEEPTDRFPQRPRPKGKWKIKWKVGLYRYIGILVYKGLNNYQYPLEVCLRYPILCQYKEYGTMIWIKN